MAKLPLEAVKAPVKRSVRNTDEVVNGDGSEKKLELDGFIISGVVG